MNLKYLIPTLKSACTSAHIRHALGTLSKDSAMAIAFDGNGDPHVLFISATSEEMKCPDYISIWCVLFGEALSNFAASVAGLNLDTDQSISRMTYIILSLLPTRLYEIQGADERILQLAAALSHLAVTGITQGIAAATSPANKLAAATTADHPERN